MVGSTASNSLIIPLGDSCPSALQLYYSPPQDYWNECNCSNRVISSATFDRVIVTANLTFNYADSIIASSYFTAMTQVKVTAVNDVPTISITTSGILNATQGVNDRLFSSIVLQDPDTIGYDNEATASAVSRCSLCSNYSLSLTIQPGGVGGLLLQLAKRDLVYAGLPYNSQLKIPCI